MALWPGPARGLDTDDVAQALAAVPSLTGESVPPTVTPEPTPETPRAAGAARGGRRTEPVVERWRWLVGRYGWDPDEALRVIFCESRGDPGAVNQTSGAAGLLQLLGWGWLARRLFGTSDVLDPAVNVGTAFHLWRDSGGSFWGHWRASAACWG